LTFLDEIFTLLLLFIMTLTDFSSLTRFEQAEYLSGAFFLAIRKEGDFDVLLYRLHNFYVEAYYHWEKPKLSRIRAFPTNRHMETYLDAWLN
jgi:hypothetical protein